jgi:MFS family permease
MNRQHLRYFLTAMIATLIVSILVGGLIVSLLPAGAGAAFVAGWWANLATAGTVGIIAGRKVAQIYEDPRLGRIAGSAVGLWAGVGAALGQLLFGVFVANVYRADVRMGLVAVFMFITFVVTLIAATIAGRETAHPPAEEEA